VTVEVQCLSFGLLAIHMIGGSIALLSTAGTFPLHE